MAKPPEPDPTVEIGNANNGIVPWSSFFDANEETTELRFPQSIRTYDQMRNDDQISGLLLSFILPILGYQWYIEPNGARDETVEHVAGDFGLAIEGQDEPSYGRSRDRFSHIDYLRHSLLKLCYGTMFFEQVYRLGESDNKLHIRKLAPRMPGSIQQIQSDRDGGLLFIRQFPSGQAPTLFDSKSHPILGDFFQGPIIPVSRLVAHVNEKEGGNWYGRPWLRSIFRNWLMKDRLLRVDALKHERNGMGVPTGLTQPGTTEGAIKKLLAVVTKWKAGETSAAALPPGTNIELKGVQGSLPDTLASIRYHDEQIARRFIAEVFMLGSTQTGARALGETLIEAMNLAQESVAKSYADTTNEHVIEDLVDVNYSIDENAPLLKFRPDAERKLAVADLVALIQANGITVDEELESYIRAEYNLPELQVPRPPSPLTVVPAAGNRERIQMVGERGPELLKLPGGGRIRNLAEQRKPNEHEKAAKTDFEALNRSYEDALSFLLVQWNAQIKPVQIDSLVAQIAGTVTFADIAAIEAPVLGSDLLGTELGRVATLAISLAVQEAKAQGVTIDALSVDQFMDSITARSEAMASVMAASITEAAARRAVQQANEDTAASDLADAVRTHLESLTDTYLSDNFGAAIHTAQNDARLTQLDEGPVSKWYASELSDSPTICLPCEEVDDTEYDTLEEGRVDYPTGFYRDCLGFTRCRGTLVAVMEAEQAPTVNDVGDGQ